MAKGDHSAQAITMDGEELFARSLANDQADIEAAIDADARHRTVAIVNDMTASVAQLLLSVAAERGVSVAYVTGLQMRRAADLYTWPAKTDPHDAFVIADFARHNSDRLTWLKVADELLIELRY